MTCFYPVRLESDRVARHVVACGQCRGCRLERSRQWAVRCVHEASLHERNAYITLTYDDEHLPANASLFYRDFQLFMKKLRRTRKEVRFFCAGEYGEDTFRPHYHACLFNVGFDDGVKFKKSAGGDFWLYQSAVLDDLWKKGFASFGEVSFESAAYVARYVMKKVTGDVAEGYYGDLVPEFAHMSLRPAIGKDWIRLYWPEVLREGKVVVNGRSVAAPKFYLRYLRQVTGFQALVDERNRFMLEHGGDRVPSRMRAREKVLNARISHLRRSL